MLRQRLSVMYGSAASTGSLIASMLRNSYPVRSVARTAVAYTC